MRNSVKLVLSLLTSFSAGAIGSVFTFRSVITWYPALNKPSFTPPGWVFGPVWTILYILIALSFYIYWTTEKEGINKNKGYVCYFTQMILNAVWSIVFFGLKSPFLGAIAILFLLAYIIATAYYFSKVSTRAAYLLIPYIAWVSFAAVLNYAVAILNK